MVDHIPGLINIAEYVCYTSKLLTLIVSQVSSLQLLQVSHFVAHKVASVACCSQVSQVSCYHNAYVVPITT
jgi:hypothetical protein